VSGHLLRVNLYLHRWTALAWIVGLAAMAFMVAALYRSVGAFDYGQFIRNLPNALIAAMGLDPKALPPAGSRYPVESWLTQEFLSWAPLAVGIYGVVYGSGAIAREAENRTLDLVLSHPVPRAWFVVAKALVFLVSVTLLVVASGVALQAGLAAAGTTFHMANLYLALFEAALAGLAIGGYSLLFSCLFLSTGKAAAVGGLLTVAFYAIDLVSRTVASIGWLGNVSLFHFYQAQRVLSTGHLDWTGVAVWSLIAVGAVACAAAAFQRRDILV
jgi:ABC-2 type transport system permease protein